MACETDRQLVIEWSNDREVPAEFTDIWGMPSCVIVRPIQGPLYSEGFKEDADGNLTIRTCHLSPFAGYIDAYGFAYYASHLCSGINARTEVWQVLNSITKPKTRRLVGALIRHADAHADNKTPTWFVEKLHELPENTGIYLTTDDRVVSGYMHEWCSDIPLVLVEQSKSYEYDRTTVIQCWADVEVLVGWCDFVLGSYTSAWSQVVALMRGAEYNGEGKKLGNLKEARYCDWFNWEDGIWPPRL